MRVLVKTLSAALTLISMTGMSAGTPARAQQAAQAAQSQSNGDSSQTKRFQLSAMYSNKPELSRKEIDPFAMQSGPMPQIGPSVPKVTLAPKAPALDAMPNNSKPKADSSYLQEYNVDWSGWITVQADRWYYTLKSTEDFLGLHFMTVRPAMIQFTCYADGSIGNIELKQSSGVPAYDRLQIETLRATMPIPRFPKGTHRDSITLCQGWESHEKQAGEADYVPGSFGRDFPKERVSQWSGGR